MAKPRVNIHWFRRDLRLEDNNALFRALTDHGEVLPLFIFDTEILDELEDKRDRRVDFLHRKLVAMKEELERKGGSLVIEQGRPLDCWKRVLDRYEVTGVTVNHDHEPYANERDTSVAELLRSHGIELRSFKDISIFERGEVLKDDGSPYTVYTPYSRKWHAQLKQTFLEPFASEKKLSTLFKTAPLPMPSLEDIGFLPTDLEVPPIEVHDALLRKYHLTRNIPGIEGTSRMSTHLRFGTVSPRALMRRGLEVNGVYANELIWREFFMQILWHFPHVVTKSFKPAYDDITWRNNEGEFAAWCEGRTGYPLVDAGMRELNASGLMHNRVRMVVSSFLTKHLLIDWRWGEAYFAKKLLDFELSSNNGGWQWASGSGCDAAPYFRVFNPSLQQEKFDPELTYVKRWVPEYGGKNYVRPIVVHEVARNRVIEAYKVALDAGRKRDERQHELFN
jgi:deoxyribodipyrimidine photo-lyase